MQFDTVVAGGTVVTAADTFHADVGIIDGRIACLGPNLSSSAQKVIDATGRLVLPGGIDAHCHLDQQSPAGVDHADDFFSGTRSAAAGGTTTIIPFANQRHGHPLKEVVEAYREKAQKAVIDYAFHLILCDPNPGVIEHELPSLIEEGYTSFKVFMAYDNLHVSDRQILELMDLSRREHTLVMVHAENHDCCEWLTEKLLTAGMTQPKYHVVAHGDPVEREATYRAIALAEVAGAQVLIVHVSSGNAMREIAAAQQRGIPVLAETCPQYLFLSDDDMDRPGFEGAKFICSPPPRERENQDLIWRGIQTGVFQVFSSDHAPYRFEGASGKGRHGHDAPFNKIANGIPGLATRLPLLFSAGVRRGRISLQRFVEITATNPAKIYGLYPRKGSIAIGSDADLAIWDPEKIVTITKKLLHDNMDYTPYEGMEVEGWPVLTMSRGDVICADGEITAVRGRGQFLPCDRIQNMSAYL
jgi:dihydropyrimidinase